ncbi:MAG: YciI family protein [Ferruginibacter sp.]
MKQFLLVAFCFAAFTSQAQDSTKAKLKQYLGVLTLTEKYRDEKNWTKQDEGIVGAHFQRLVKFKNEGIVVLAGRTNYETNNPDMQGLVIFYASDDEAAKQFMLEDPAVKNSIMLAKVHPYSIAINKCE